MSSQVPLDALILVLGFSIDAEVLAARPSPRLHWQASLSIITLASIHLQVLAQTTKQPDAGYSIFFSTLEYHANTIRSSLLMWMTWLPDFSLLSLDSNILQCFLPHGPIAQAFVYHASEVLQQNVQLTGTPQMKTTETCNKKGIVYIGTATECHR